MNGHFFLVLFVDMMHSRCLHEQKEMFGHQNKMPMVHIAYQRRTLNDNRWIVGVILHCNKIMSLVLVFQNWTFFVYSKLIQMNWATNRKYALFNRIKKLIDEFALNMIFVVVVFFVVKTAILPVKDNAEIQFEYWWN